MINFLSYFAKQLLSYFFISFCTIVIFLLYLSSTDYSGGEVGMAPFAIAIQCLVTIGITSLVIIFLKLFGVEISIIKNALLFTIIYILILIFFFGGNPFEPKKYLRDLDLWAVLGCISGYLIIRLRTLVRKNFI